MDPLKWTASNYKYPDKFSSDHWTIYDKEWDQTGSGCLPSFLVFTGPITAAFVWCGGVLHEDNQIIMDGQWTFLPKFNLHCSVWGREILAFIIYAKFRTWKKVEENFE